MRKQKGKRADGRYQVSIDLKSDDGKRHRKFFYSTVSLADAKKKRDRYMEDHTYSHPDGSLREWCDIWLTAYKATVSPATRDTYRASVNQICRFGIQGTTLGEMQIADIRPADIQMFVNSLAGTSRSNIQKQIVTLRQIFRTAVENKRIHTSPVGTLSRPKGTYKGHRVITAEEEKLIGEMWRSYHAGLWAIIMLYTGMRREEIAALDWKDIDMRKHMISISRAADLGHGGALKETKSVAGVRTVPILIPLEEVLRECHANVSGPVCTNQHGGPLTASSWLKAWRPFAAAVSEASGCEPITPHDLRYSYASMLYDNSVDVKTAQYLLGHSSITVTLNIYTKLSAGKKAASFQALRENVRSAVLPE